MTAKSIAKIKKYSPRVGIVSLGCPKALVDSERILSQLRMQGDVITDTYKKADVVIVNTCGFLNSARQESLDTIHEALAENGKVIVTGCMGKDSGSILKLYPEVLSVTGPQQYEQVVMAVNKAVPPKHDPFIDLVPLSGVKLTPRHYAYLKISEGCHHRCSFCIIPSLRGDLVSRPIHEILLEAEDLVKAGVKELLIISQDTGAYGLDLKHQESIWQGRSIKTNLKDLCTELGKLGVWVRLHYVYPYPHIDDIIPLMTEGKILPYLDIPFQHASPKILKAMRRPANQTKILERIANWRKIVPNITIRSTFIVGFPGESDDDFEFLLDWLQEAQIDRAGCFRYENVDGAAANALPDAVDEAVKNDRWERFMEVQRDISNDKMQKKIGSVISVLIDQIDGEQAVARSMADAPEIDGNVYVDMGSQRLKIGDLVNVKITSANDYDLYGYCI